MLFWQFCARVSLAQICYSIIAALAVSMVELTFWPFAIDIKPCKSMR